MNYNEFYYGMKNPLDDNEVIRKMVKAYGESRDFYSLITNTSKDKVKGKYYPTQEDHLYKLLFDEWKKYIKISIEYPHTLPEYRERARRIYDYIKDLEPTTKDEILHILSDTEGKDDDLIEAFERCRFTRLCDGSSWTHIDSSYVHCNLYYRDNIEHRLYVNSDSTLTHFLLSKIVEKCRDRRLNYYFKFDDIGNRDDNIVFYCSTRQLPIFINLLEEIKNEYSLDEFLHEPPILTGKVNGWIGYGTEPENGYEESFNSKRADHLEKCLDEVTINWIKNSMNKELNIEGQTMSYEDLIIKSLVKEVKDYILDYYCDDGDIKYFYKRYGFSLESVKSYEFEKAISDTIKPIINDIINDYENNTLNRIEVPFNGGNYTLNFYILNKVIRQQALFFLDNDSNYKEVLVNRIKETSQEIGIDPNNYAFDLYALDLFTEEDKKRELSNMTTSEEETTVKDNPKVKRKRYAFKPLSDEDINNSKERLGFA